jgi:hypothetical protein
MEVEELRAVGAALLSLILSSGLGLLFDGVNQPTWLYVAITISSVLLIGLIGTMSLSVWRERRVAKEAPGERGRAVSTSTLKGGELTGDARLKIESSAEHLTDGTVIGGRVQLEAIHDPAIAPANNDGTNSEP